jgi:hypothetical protein
VVNYNNLYGKKRKEENLKCVKYDYIEKRSGIIKAGKEIIFVWKFIPSK